VIIAFNDNGSDLSGAMTQATIFCPRRPVSQAQTGRALRKIHCSDTLKQGDRHP
jgi:hypothetical protein